MRRALAIAALIGVALAQPNRDQLTAWQRLPPIDAAVQVAELDGPEEITEKAEIIADRRDALRAAQVKVAADCREIGLALRAVRRQEEALRELTRIRARRDIVLRQRQQDLRVRRRELTQLESVCATSEAGLAEALRAVGALHTEYLKRAEQVRQEEIRP